DAPTVGYAWPKIGCANFDRFKQAWWDAFHGTAQPLFREEGDSGPRPYVHIYVDEVGYQAKIAPEKASLYTGSENVPVLDEATQGNYYAQLIAMMACDPNVALLNFFHAVDETSLPAWQSGLVLPDGTRRASFTAVRDAIMANQECKGKLVEWRHTDRVVGAGVSFKTLPRSFLVRADEGFSYEVKITRTSSTRRLTGAVGQGEAARDLLFKLPRLGRGTYRVTVTLHAETNAQRRSRARSAARRRTCPIWPLSGRPGCDIRIDMTDPRVAKLADLLVNYSLELQPGQIVRLDGGTVAAPFVQELYRSALRVGANPRTRVEVEGLDVIAVGEATEEQLT